jgi:UDP-N-acetyl-2-amino-2-deoxyglucuronate dehydrogenase
VADVVPELAEELADEHECPHYASLEEMLSGVDLDAVCVCTPSGMHAEGVIAALEAGKDVVIEKPVDVTLKAAERLIEVQYATGGRVTVISQHRFDAATQAVHEALSRGEFGRLTSGSADVRWWRSQSYYDSGGWRGAWELDGGGVLINQARWGLSQRITAQPRRTPSACHRRKRRGSSPVPSREGPAVRTPPGSQPTCWSRWPE